MKTRALSVGLGLVMVVVGGAGWTGEASASDSQSRCRVRVSGGTPLLIGYSWASEAFIYENVTEDHCLQLAHAGFEKTLQCSVGFSSYGSSTFAEVDCPVRRVYWKWSQGDQIKKGQLRQGTGN